MKFHTVKPIRLNIKKMSRNIRKDRKSHPVKYFFKDTYKEVIIFVGNILMYIKRFIQRGKRGYANCDVWGLDCYLADVIEHSIMSLKKNLNGHPVELTEGQWMDILNSISYTFYLAKECSEGDLILMRDKKDREKFDKTFTNKDNIYRYMTTKEIRDYDLGWKNFKQYFWNLWD